MSPVPRCLSPDSELSSFSDNTHFNAPAGSRCSSSTGGLFWNAAPAGKSPLHPVPYCSPDAQHSSRHAQHFRHG